MIAVDGGVDGLVFSECILLEERKYIGSIILLVIIHIFEMMHNVLGLRSNG